MAIHTDLEHVTNKPIDTRGLIVNMTVTRVMLAINKYGYTVQVHTSYRTGI